MDEEKLLEIIKGQSVVISALTELVQTLSSQIDCDVVISGFKKAPNKDA
ncbi:hypothetical protein [Leuconostoc falkenbergense]|nr:hypothetical protein [Leuconostoc falkenbergense]